MRVVVAGWVDLPAEKRAEALEKAKPLIDGAYTEKGCIAYEWSADPYNPQRIRVYEEWEEGEDLEVHLNDKWYDGMRAHLAAYEILGAENFKYRVDLKEPVYTEEGVATAHFKGA